MRKNIILFSLMFVGLLSLPKYAFGLAMEVTVDIGSVTIPGRSSNAEVSLVASDYPRVVAIKNGLQTSGNCSAVTGVSCVASGNDINRASNILNYGILAKSGSIANYSNVYYLDIGKSATLNYSYTAGDRTGIYIELKVPCSTTYPNYCTDTCQNAGTSGANNCGNTLYYTRVSSTTWTSPTCGSTCGNGGTRSGTFLGTAPTGNVSSTNYFYIYLTRIDS